MEQKKYLRVRYVETDAQGIVHHATYPVWFEEGRSDFLRKIEMPYSQWEQCGYFASVVDLSIRYVKPAYYEDELQIITILERYNKRFVEFKYKVFNEEENLLAHGHTKHLIVDTDGQPYVMNDTFFQQLKSKVSEQ
ncbi:MAG: 4-hydroxybenzoyl-CoA thioesterase [Desulfobacteraceae bacterium 4572_35.1]|nr:MAG: 4-hydroxybenzoyl-CoA thioesterase [Desulfobacteraceae bacterium 4572_35.1]